MEEIINIAWEDAENMIEVLGDCVRKDRFIPDFICGISRGGFVLASLIAFRMPSWVPVCYFDIERDRKDSRKRIIRSSSFSLGINLKEKKVILCEDTIESGRTLIVIKEWLEAKGAKVRILALFAHLESEITPKYIFQEGIKPGEISLPWDRFQER